MLAQEDRVACDICESTKKKRGKLTIVLKAATTHIRHNIEFEVGEMINLQITTRYHLTVFYIKFRIRGVCFCSGLCYVYV